MLTVTERFLQNSCVWHVASALYCPTTNGQVERRANELKQALAKSSSVDLSCRLARFLFKQHTTVNTTTGKIPAQPLFKQELLSPLSRLVTRGSPVQQETSDLGSKDPATRLCAQLPWSITMGTWKAPWDGGLSLMAYRDRFGDPRGSHRSYSTCCGRNLLKTWPCIRLSAAIHDNTSSDEGGVMVPGSSGNRPRADDNAVAVMAAATPLPHYMDPTKDHQASAGDISEAGTAAATPCPGCAFPSRSATITVPAEGQHSDLPKKTSAGKKISKEIRWLHWKREESVVVFLRWTGADARELVGQLSTNQTTSNRAQERIAASEHGLIKLVVFVLLVLDLSNNSCQINYNFSGGKDLKRFV